MEDTYKTKYFKYKAKYLALKNQSVNFNGQKGGMLDDSFSGGGSVFSKEGVLYILADITDQNLKNGFKERTDILIGPTKKPFNDPHVTIHSMIIDLGHPNSTIFQNQNFI